MSRREHVPVLILFALSALLGGSEFRGCTGAGAEDLGPDGGRPLPEVTGGGCLVDTDCRSDDMCVELACVGGACVEVGPAFDGDGDGFAPAPCGEDCNDFVPSTFPGATETCNSADDDCDGEIDEDAPGARARPISDGLARVQIVGLGDVYAAVGLDEATSALSAYLVGQDGGATTAVRLEDLVDPRAFAIVRGGAGVIVYAAVGPDAEVARQELRLDVDRLATTGAPTTIGTELGAVHLAATVLDGQEWLVVDAGAPGGAASSRWMWRSGDGSVTPLAFSFGDPAGAIAHDGTNVVVTESSATLRFLAADGSTVATQTLPGDFATGPLAPGEGFVFAAYKDAFDHNLARVTSTRVGDRITAPAGNREEDVRIFWAPPYLLVSRTNDTSSRAWLFDESLRSFAASFVPAQISTFTDRPTVTSVGTTDDGLSALCTGYTAHTSVAVLTCRSL